MVLIIKLCSLNKVTKIKDQLKNFKTMKHYEAVLFVKLSFVFFFLKVNSV